MAPTASDGRGTPCAHAASPVDVRRPPGSVGERRRNRAPRARRRRSRSHPGADDMTLTLSAFDLPAHLSAKADPRLIAGDEQHFAAVAQSLEETIADLSARLDAARKA